MPRRINLKEYEEYTIRERKQLLSNIKKDLKKYKNMKEFDYSDRKIESESVIELLEKIKENYELIRSDSQIILCDRKIVKKNLSDLNIKLIGSQMSNINYMNLLNSYVLEKMCENDQEKVKILSKSSGFIHWLIDLCDIKLNEDSSISEDSVNEIIENKHNAILELSNEIRKTL